MINMMPDPLVTLFLIVRERERVLFEGEASALSSFNERGLFDILPEHTNFISLIKDFLVVHKLDGTQSEIKIKDGVLKVYKNRVWVYLGILSV